MAMKCFICQEKLSSTKNKPIKSTNPDLESIWKSICYLINLQTHESFFIEQPYCPTCLEFLQTTHELVKHFTSVREHLYYLKCGLVDLLVGNYGDLIVTENPRSKSSSVHDSEQDQDKVTTNKSQKSRLVHVREQNQDRSPSKKSKKSRPTHVRDQHKSTSIPVSKSTKTPTVPSSSGANSPTQVELIEIDEDDEVPVASRSQIPSRNRRKVAVLNYGSQHNPNLNEFRLNGLETDSQSQVARACKTCKKVMTFSQLLVHVQSHLKDWETTCKLCGFGHSSNNRLRIHIYIHYNVDPYQCTLCGKNFWLEETAMNHVAREHLKPKPFANYIVLRVEKYLPLVSRPNLEILKNSSKTLPFVKKNVKRKHSEPVKLPDSSVSILANHKNTKEVASQSQPKPEILKNSKTLPFLKRNVKEKQAEPVQLPASAVSIIANHKTTDELGSQSLPKPKILKKTKTLPFLKRNIEKKPSEPVEIPASAVPIIANHKNTKEIGSQYRPKILRYSKTLPFLKKNVKKKHSEAVQLHASSVLIRANRRKTKPTGSNSRPKRTSRKTLDQLKKNSHSQFKCAICSQILSSKWALKRHLQSVHQIEHQIDHQILSHLGSRETELISSTDVPILDAAPVQPEELEVPFETIVLLDMDMKLETENAEAMKLEPIATDPLELDHPLELQLECLDQVDDNSDLNSYGQWMEKDEQLELTTSILGLP